MPVNKDIKNTFSSNGKLIRITEKVFSITWQSCVSNSGTFRFHAPPMAENDGLYPRQKKFSIVADSGTQAYSTKKGPELRRVPLFHAASTVPTCMPRQSRYGYASK